MKTISKIKEKELATWQKNLADILHENALLKYMLSEIVDTNQEKDFLPVAEYFQNELLLKDEKLQILLKQINEFAAVSQQNRYEKMRQEILHFQKEYNAFAINFKSKCYKKGSH